MGQVEKRRQSDLRKRIGRIIIGAHIAGRGERNLNSSRIAVAGLIPPY